MYYGAYKNSRNASWQCLIDNKIKELPTDVIAIANNSNIRVIKNSNINRLEPNESGICLLVGSDYFIIYDDTQNRGRRRFTIAHELGHIFLGHLLIDSKGARTFDTSRPQIEQEADVFASRLLAPACILWGLGLKTPEQISKVCEISYTAAKIRAERMELLYKRNKFLTSSLERKVFDNFKDFIDKNKAKD